MENKKNIIRRISMGTVATGLEIFALIFVNIFLVPLYLSNWDIMLYSGWILLITLRGFINFYRVSHGYYVYYELFNLKKTKNNKVYSYIFSNICSSFIISSLISILVVMGANFKFFSDILKINIEITNIWNESLIYLIILSGFYSNYEDFFISPLSIKGKYYFYAWLKTLKTFFTNSAPAIIVFNGGNFYDAVVMLMITEIIINSLIYLIIFKSLNIINFKNLNINLVLGFKTFKNSLILLLKNLIDYFKLTGIRFLVSFFYDASNLVIFVLTRTLANILAHFSNSISNPLLPEMMNFINQKENKKLISTFEIFFIFITTLLCPLIYFSQIIVPYFFKFWTLDKITFNPFLYAILINSILIYSIIVPAENILKGRNLTKLNLKISLYVILIIISLILITHQYNKIFYVGCAIFVSEVFNFLITYYTLLFRTDKNLKKIIKQLLLLLFSVITTLVCCLILAYSNNTLTITLIFLIVILLNTTLSVSYSSKYTFNIINKFLNKLKF